jgi:hypothetical protein
LNLITDHKDWTSDAHRFGDFKTCQLFVRDYVVADSFPSDLEELKENFLMWRRSTKNTEKLLTLPKKAAYDNGRPEIL